jgi:hypothetical protein
MRHELMLPHLVDSILGAAEYPLVRIYLRVLTFNSLARALALESCEGIVIALHHLCPLLEGLVLRLANERTCVYVGIQVFDNGLGLGPLVCFS